MTDMQKICDFIDGAGLFFLSTENGDQPKCRPMRSHFLAGSRLYFGTGRFKDVFRQMTVNPRVEIVTVSDDKFLRYWGVAAFEETYDMAESILDKMPQMRSVYTMEGDMKLEMFHLEDAHAEIRSMAGLVEELAV